MKNFEINMDVGKTSYGARAERHVNFAFDALVVAGG